MLVTLNGGIWADAAGNVPEWDVNDRLEEDPANCQWNERDEVMPDDYLRHLPGSHAAPELARALTLNVYAATCATTRSATCSRRRDRSSRFMRAHPDLLVGVNLDPDVYINPFFAEAQWYDYNPGTLRQFRQWLAGTGPYAGDARARRAGPFAERRRVRCHCATWSIARRPFRGMGRRRSAARFSARSPRARSGATRGCANGRHFAVISSACITTSSPNGSSKPAFRASGSGRRRD